MGRPKKDPAQVRSVPLNFRVSPAVKDAIDEMVRRRAATTGDDSITGWFVALVHQEAADLKIPITNAPAAPQVPVMPDAAPPAPPSPRRAEDAAPGLPLAGTRTSEAPVALRPKDLAPILQREQAASTSTKPRGSR